MFSTLKESIVNNKTKALYLTTKKISTFSFNGLRVDKVVTYFNPDQTHVHKFGQRIIKKQMTVKKVLNLGEVKLRRQLAVGRSLIVFRYCKLTFIYLAL